MLFKLDGYKDYTKLLSKVVRDGNVDIFEKIIGERLYDEYKVRLLEDHFMKQKLINSVLNANDEGFSLIIFDLFGMRDKVPEYDSINELLYMRDNCIINRRKNIEYIFSDNNFEEFWSMDNLYQLCENDYVLNRITKDLENMIGRKLEDYEKKYVLESSRRYREYIDNDFRGIINEIKMDDETPDSEGECYGILYEYLGHRPNKFEVKLLWETLR